MKLRDAVRQALFLNELSGNPAAIYRLSAAKGGTSGWSFGRTQLDAANNPAAIACLKECGFTSAEISRIKAKEGDRHAYTSRLAAHAAIIDKYDEAQITECMNHVINVTRSRRVTFEDDHAIVQLADYHNQFYLATNGKMAKALSALGRSVTAEDILAVKLDTAWGRTAEGCEDIERRYNNIARLMGGKTVNLT